MDGAQPPLVSKPSYRVSLSMAAMCACGHPLAAHLVGPTNRECRPCQTSGATCQAFRIWNRAARRRAKHRAKRGR